MDLITVSRKGGLAFQIGVRGHQVTTDFRKDEGGRDEGPTPVDFVVGALGACVGIMAQRYCDTLGCKDGEVSVSLTYTLEKDPSRVGAITIDLEVPKDFPEGKRKALERVAHLCPVQATLDHPPRVDLEII